MLLTEFIDQNIDAFNIGMADGDAELVKRCFSSRGKGKGYLLNNCPSPSTDPLRAAAWKGIMTNLAPQRAGMFSMIFMGDSERAVFDRCERRFDKRYSPGWYHALNTLGQRPFQFNMYAYHHDLDAVRDALQNNLLALAA